jgi:hypothetical protein
MIRRLWYSAFMLAACAPAATTPPTAPVATTVSLAYAVPPAGTAVYAINDTSTFDIKAGPMGEIRAGFGTSAKAEVTYTQKAANLEATIKLIEFSGSLTNSATGTGQTASASDVQGAATLSVTPRGVITVTAMPKISGGADRIGINEGFFRRLFVRLPAGAVQPGSTWTDTIIATDSSGGLQVASRDIVTSTFARDSSVAGHRVAVITTTAQRTLNIAGNSEGMQIKQTLAGTSSGIVLWDAARGLLVQRTDETTLTGTFDLPAMGVSGLPVAARSSYRAMLR